MKVGATRLLVTLAAAGALALAGCGGGDDHSGSTASSAGTTTTTESSQGQSGDGNGTESASGTSKKLALGSPADVPRSEGGDNSIQDYGSEASEADRAAAGRALQAYYDALVSGDTEGACALLTSRTRDGIEKTLEQLKGQGGSNAPTTCPQILKLTVRSDPHSPQLRLTELLSLRRQGDAAFLIYRAGDGKVYAIAMSEENGNWRVGGVSAAPLAA